MTQNEMIGEQNVAENSGGFLRRYFERMNSLPGWFLPDAALMFMAYNQLVSDPGLYRATRSRSASITASRRLQWRRCAARLESLRPSTCSMTCSLAMGRRTMSASNRLSREHGRIVSHARLDASDRRRVLDGPR